MLKILSGVFALFLSVGVSAEPLKCEQLLTEYQRLHEYVQNTKAEFEVGGLFKGKQFGDYKLLWKLAQVKGESEVIRIYRDKGDKQQAFEVSYFRNDLIVPGKTVIRRFIGPAATGWRNDTIDAFDGRYLGHQGTENPYLDERDQEILSEWDIKPIN